MAIYTIKETQKEINGSIYFYYNNGNIDKIVYEKREDFDLFHRPRNIYDLMSGLKFAELVEDGSFIDNDGSMANVFVNGYDSNLGICADENQAYFHKGEFMVDLNTFKKLCEEYEIEVNWANK